MRNNVDDVFTAETGACDHMSAAFQIGDRPAASGAPAGIGGYARRVENDILLKILVRGDGYVCCLEAGGGNCERIDNGGRLHLSAAEGGSVCAGPIYRIAATNN